MPGVARGKKFWKKNVSPIGLAVWSAIHNIYLYTNVFFYYTDDNNDNNNNNNNSMLIIVHNYNYGDNNDKNSNDILIKIPRILI